MKNWLKNTLTKPYFAIVWTLVILGLCFTPRQEMPEGLGWDKLHHFGAFGILGALWYWTKLRPFWVIIAGTMFGFLVEIGQHVLPIGRTFDLYDGLADAIGVITAIPIARWIWKEKDG